MLACWWPGNTTVRCFPGDARSGELTHKDFPSTRGRTTVCVCVCVFVRMCAAEHAKIHATYCIVFARVRVCLGVEYTNLVGNMTHCA